jgi:hypothetical protein
MKTIINFASQQLVSSETFFLELVNPNGFEVDILDANGVRHSLHNVSTIDWCPKENRAYFGSRLFTATYAPEASFLQEVTITFAIAQADEFMTAVPNEKVEVYAGV